MLGSARLAECRTRSRVPAGSPSRLSVRSVASLVAASTHIGHSSSVADSIRSTSSRVNSYQAASFQYGAVPPPASGVSGNTSPCWVTVSRQPSRGCAVCRHTYAMLAQTTADTARAAAAVT